MKRTLALILLLVSIAVTGQAGSLMLAWDASSGAAGYKLYYGTIDGPPYQAVLDVGAATTASVGGLTDGERYYFAATAVNGALESDFSNEVSQLIASPPPTNPIAINAGGEAYTASDGTVYSADMYFNGGNVYSSGANIEGTTDDTLYRTERSSANFRYDIPVPNATYLVTLKFTELGWNRSNRRVFDVLIEGQEVVSNLDLFAQVGRYRAYDQTFTAQVTDGVLTIRFRADRDNAQVSAISVIPQ